MQNQEDIEKEDTQGQDRRRTMTKYHVFEHPLNGMSFEDRIEMAKQAGQRADADYCRNLEELEALVLKSHPLVLLSVLSIVSLLPVESLDIESDSQNPHLQHHVELVQSLALRHSLDSFQYEDPNIERVLQLAKELSDNFAIKRLRDINVEQTEVERQKLQFLESVRLYTQAIRNSGYPQIIREMLKDLWSPLDDDFESAYHVRPTAIIDLFFSIILEIEDRIEAYLQALSLIKSHTTVDDACDVYEQLGFDDDSQSLRSELKEADLPLTDVQQILLSRCEIMLVSISTFSQADFERLYTSDVTWSDLKKILEMWSLHFGDLAGKPVDHLFLGTPIWSQPFILLDEHFFLPIPNLLQSYPHVLLESLVPPTGKLKQKFHKRRAEYLETDLHVRFSRAFPRAKVLRGSYYDIGTIRYENDLLILIDRYAIVVEAKTKRVSESARRGGVQVEPAIRELIEEPAIQAERFVQFLRANPSIHRFETKRGEVNEADLTSVKYFLKLAVIMDDVTLHWNWPELKKTGLIDQTVKPLPVSILADLIVVLEMLERSSEKLHYLQRRNAIESLSSYHGDELDFLGLYFTSGLRLSDSFLAENELHLHRTSEIFEPFYMAPWSGLEVPKPTPKLTRIFEQILTRIELSDKPGWAEVGVRFLNMDFREQIEIIKTIRQLRKFVKTSKHVSVCVPALFRSSWLEPPEYFLLAIYKKVNNEDLAVQLAMDAKSTLAKIGTQSLIVIAYDSFERVFSESGSIFLYENDCLSLIS